MKTWLGEYGRIILLAIAAFAILSFAMSKSGTGLLGMLGRVKPEATAGDADSAALVDNISEREPPSLSVRVKKLKAGETYNLLDEAVFQIQAFNAEGEKLAVSIAKLLGPDGEEVLHQTDPFHFVPDRGGYQITYYVEEIYLTAKKSVEKTYYFIAD